MLSQVSSEDVRDLVEYKSCSALPTQMTAESSVGVDRNRSSHHCSVNVWGKCVKRASIQRYP